MATNLFDFLTAPSAAKASSLGVSIAQAAGYRSPIQKDIDGMRQDITDLGQMRAKLDARYQAVQTQIYGDKSPRANDYLADMKQLVSQATAKAATSSFLLSEAIVKASSLTVKTLAGVAGVEYAKKKAEAKTAANVARNMINNASKKVDEYSERSRRTASGKPPAPGPTPPGQMPGQILPPLVVGGDTLGALKKWLPWVFIGGIGLYALSMLRPGRKD